MNKDYLRRLGLKAPQQTTRQRWPDWTETGGRFAPKWVAGLVRNGWPLCSEICNDDRAHSNIAGLYQPDDDDFIPTVVTIYTAHFTIDTKLVDTQNFTPVWQATSKSKEVVHGPNDVSLEEIMESYGSALVNEWIKEGVVLNMAKK